ncbi:phage minor capsid protein [Bacillus sp. ISL-37]|uniref:phage minor capsid protein n=1 Tax=Bacillus sp. ISL-37 TaxID=2819123 RepID=UPI001BEA15AF|nr:phage minor capsid protein [Bacillus sp. ISL-37]MBT2682652.1 minor capsid protein [Bacillus sp. ISL-37]
MLTSPGPNYNYDVEEVVRAYEKAIDAILRELERIDLTNFQRANALATLKSISEILAELNEQAGKLAQERVEKATRDGVIRALISLEVAASVVEAEKIVAFNRLNKEMVAAAVADTQADLLAVTQNIEKKVRAAVRQATAEAMRNNLPRGINASDPIRRAILADLRKTLGDSVNTGIIDAAGRRWKPTTYVDVLVRTKMMQAHKEATINEAVPRGAVYGIISKHGAKDACRNYEGKIVKLDRSAEGNYPYIYDLPKREIFHPYCKHVVSPFRRIDRLPADIQQANT